MHRRDPPPSSLRTWSSRVAATLATALFTTPIAGSVGGAVFWLALRLQQPEASLLLLLAFLFYGALIGSLIAAPVTLIVLPAATLLLHARPRLSRWLLPLLGLLAGVLRFGDSIAAPPGSGRAPDPRDADLTLLLAGAIAGMAAGLLSAWLPRALSPRGFPRPSTGTNACAPSS